VISIIIHSYVLSGLLFTFCVSNISYCILQFCVFLCFFFFFPIFKVLVRIFMVFFSCFFFFFPSSVSIIITNSSESLTSNLYTSVFWLFCQR